jgi:hypothetical protein
VYDILDLVRFSRTGIDIFFFSLMSWRLLVVSAYNYDPTSQSALELLM